MKIFNYLRIATVVPKVWPGNPEKNLAEHLRLIDEVKKKDAGVDLIVFPELSITGYTCGDLFLTDDLINRAKRALKELRLALMGKHGTSVIVGAPIMSEKNGKLYNCAVFINSAISQIIPKKHLPEYSEFYEKRWFSDDIENLTVMGFRVNKTGIITSTSGFTMGIEICEDLWVPCPPCDTMVTRYGAQVIINISASPDLVGKREYLKTLLSATSGRLMCGYIYVSASPWESTQDLVFSGYSAVYENGKLLDECESEFDPTIKIMDIDLDNLRGYRRKNKLKTEVGEIYSDRIGFTILNNKEDLPSPYRTISPTPFICGDTQRTQNLQTLGLMKRLLSFNNPDIKSVIGVSGGTDSTWALLITYWAYKNLGYPLENIIGVSMPCFGTTKRTKGNADRLMEKLGITSKVIDISESVKSHLKDLGHPLDKYDVTYENAQARERTQLLFDLSNQVGGIVIGTGDLSELALGWCTYGADHLSSYNVNVSVPKTLIRQLLTEAALQGGEKGTESILWDIIKTPVSPELLPPGENGEIVQVSEDTVGPYELHDFFLYHFIGSGMGAVKIALLAQKAFEGTYTLEEIIEWETVFFKRFGSQQFKRSCLPDGPKTGSISLSPRGDWRMPSDLLGGMETWIKELEAYVARETDK